jgi:3-dehydroquinate dehydratase type I
MICASIGHKEQLRSLDDTSAGLVELRFDLIMDRPDHIIPLVPEGMKVIATCRPGNLSEGERGEILQSALEEGVAYVDIEIESDRQVINSLRRSAQQYRSDLIISWHDFEATPPLSDLVSILEKCYALGGDVAKIASQVRSKDDMIRLMSLYERPGRKVVLGMGEKGSLTRIAAPLLGAEFTFAASSSDTSTAPGQLTIEELHTIYKILHYQ